ncbi:MAG: response regulator [Bacteroidales bacterium]|nr:response regulator [Bacteroidales bacterium]
MKEYPVKWSQFICTVIILLLFQIIYASDSNDIKSQIEQYKTLFKKYELEGNTTELAKSASKLGYLYWQIDAKKEAIDYFDQAIQLNLQTGNKNALRVIYSNLGLIYSEQGNYQQAIESFKKSLEINLAKGNKNDAASDYLNIALSFQALGYYAESNSRAKQALEKALELDNLTLAKSCYGALAENEEKLGNNKAASGYYEKYTTLSKHLQKQEMEAMASKTKEIERQVQTKEKQLRSTLDTLGEVLELNREMQLENALLNKENQLKEAQKARLEAQQDKLKAKEKTRRTQLIAMGVVALLIFCIAVLIFWQFSQKKKANNLLKDQNAEIERQKTEIEKQRDLANIQKKKITDSIQYARRIQTAVIPPVSVIEQKLSDYFVLYKPKDIVSGDFYWWNLKDDVLIIAAADCTGHGVPGAFMSMLGVAFLNEIVNKIVVNKHISALNADEILNQLREMVITSLHQTGDTNENKDGMDISLCIIDFEHKKLQYAGANNPLYIIRDSEIIQYSPDKMPVSFHQNRNKPFRKHEVILKHDDRIYLFSDGFVDQFGGDKGLKFLSKRFKEVLVNIHKQPMEEQKKLLEKSLTDWMGDRPQLDDILVIGLRFGIQKIEEKPVSKINWQSKTILIAEDTDVNYFLLTAVLKQTNANLVRVKDGQEAIDFIKNNEVDLILMDINMPRMNGYDATRTIKQIRKDIPIIVQTAMHFEEESEEAFNAGADEYITKPIDLKTFMSKMERFLS